MLYGIVSLLVAAGLAGADQWLKAWATSDLQPLGSAPLWPGVIELRYVLNDGMAFSMLSGQRVLLVAVTGVVLVVVAGMLLFRPMPRLERLSWTLVLGGGVGNLIDRVSSGLVVDYLNFQFIDFPVFNLADICVTAGVGLLILTILLDLVAERRKAKATGGDAHDAET